MNATPAAAGQVSGPLLFRCKRCAATLVVGVRLKPDGSLLDAPRRCTCLAPLELVGPYRGRRPCCGGMRR